MTPRSLPLTLLRLPAALLLLSACGGPTYKADRLEEAVRDICWKEYGFDAQAHRAGKTLYAVIEPQALVGPDLGLDKKTIERLYDTLLTVTRVTLSTDAEIDYLVVKARDANTGVTLTLLRQVADIKRYFYMRISRADFEKRGILEIDPAGAPEDYHDVDPREFMARLAASALQQKITYNPLVSVFMRVHRVKGAFRNGVLDIRLDKFQKLSAPGEEGGEEEDPTEDLLRRSVVEDVGALLRKYDQKENVKEVRVSEEGGRTLFSLKRKELLDAEAALPRKKILGIPVENE
jgi:hypothetical protein